MRVPISGICTGFRVIKASGKETSDFGKIFIIQPADKDHDAVLITVFVQDIQLLEYILMNYSSGDFRWIDVYASQIPNGKDQVWILEKIFNLDNRSIEVGV